MIAYIIVNNASEPFSNELLAWLAKQGLLVSVAESPAVIRRQIDLHGPPALIIWANCEPSAVDAEFYQSLRTSGGTRLLVILPRQEERLLEAERTIHLVADDFLIQPVSEVELTLRIRRLCALGQADPHQGVDAGGFAAASGSGSMHNADWKEGLSATERKIIARPEAAAGRSIPIEQLAECVTGPTAERRGSALRVHINRLRQKIGVDPNQPRYIVTVRGVGYRLGALGGAEWIVDVYD